MKKQNSNEKYADFCEKKKKMKITNMAIQGKRRILMLKILTSSVVSLIPSS